MTSRISKVLVKIFPKRSQTRIPTPLYSILIALASMLPMKEAKGQDIWQIIYPKPTEPINLFISQDSTPQALEYNALKTKAARDAILVEKLKSDITSKIPGGLNPPWGCAQASFLFLNKAHNWGKNVYIGDHLLYNGYDGDDEYLIKTNEGTIKYIGTSGIPVWINEMYDPVAMPGGHGNNEVITGKEIRNGKDWNVMEVPPPWNRTNDQPGETYIPLNTDYFMI